VMLENESWQDQGILHRRYCEVGRAGVGVVDEISAPRSAAQLWVNLQWLIDGDENEVALAGSRPLEIEVARGEEGSVRGWISEMYASRRSGTSVTVRASLGASALRIASGFGEYRPTERLAELLAVDLGQWR